MDDYAGAYYAPFSGHATSQHPYYQPPPHAPSAVQPAFGAGPPPPYVQAPSHEIYPQQPSSIPYDYLEGFPNEVRTLFIAGLPEDVIPREIYNLFREFPGYESSHLRTPTGTSQSFAFAVFVDQRSAISALHALNGLVFDIEKGSILYIDLAKENSRPKRSRTIGDDRGRNSMDKRLRRSDPFTQGTSDSGVGNVHMPGMLNSAYNTTGGYPSTQSFHRGEASGMTHDAAMPCPTLFVANLGPTCTEQELTQIFSRCPGFLKLKVQGSYGGSWVAFVDFKDTASSSDARNQLQGTILHSSLSNEGMRLEFAKSRMGMRKRPK